MAKIGAISLVFISIVGVFPAVADEKQTAASQWCHSLGVPAYQGEYGGTLFVAPDTHRLIYTATLEEVGDGTFCGMVTTMSSHPNYRSYPTASTASLEVRLIDEAIITFENDSDAATMALRIDLLDGSYATGTLDGTRNADDTYSFLGDLTDDDGNIVFSFIDEDGDYGSGLTLKAVNTEPNNSLEAE
jgi:hypothetical protein